MNARRKNKKALDLTALRRASGLNQTEFWGKVHVSQSAGSSYERGYRMPRPVALLIDLAYVRGIDSAKVSRTEIRILAYLQNPPELYKKLRQDGCEARSRPQSKGGQMT